MKIKGQKVICKPISLMKEKRGLQQPPIFVIIGCGGTGGYLVRDLARFIASYKDGTKPQMLLIDGDKVEEKNIVRQNFIFNDVGSNKARVLAQRYSASFEIPIKYYSQYLTPDALAKLVDNITGSNRYAVIVSCVDNNATRMNIYRAITDNGSRAYNEGIAWIDCGNEEYTGQVVYGQREMIYPKPIITEGVWSTPFAPEVFTSIQEVTDKSPEQMSCAEFAISAPQNITANITAAQIALNYCISVITGADIEYSYVMFNTRKNVSTSIPIVVGG